MLLPKPRRGPEDAISKADWYTEDRIWAPTTSRTEVIDEETVTITTKTHGGVIDENVTFDDDGNLILIANGDWYVGDKVGVPYGANETLVSGGQRTGARVTSVDAFGPGSFEVEMKIPAFNGICSSIWLFNYYNDSVNPDYVHNDEIDIEIHGTTSSNVGNLSAPLFSTWLTETLSNHQYVPTGYNLADGNFHTYRIDWHTGDTPYIDYYIDGVKLCTFTTRVPTNKMYFNIGCWFPSNWCGDPAFETDYMVVKSFKYTAFEGETATEEHLVDKIAGGFKNNVEIPQYNLLGNGDFAYALAQNNAWSVDGTAVVDNGNVTFTGTLSQVVTMDCLGNSYTLEVDVVGEDNVNVKVTYQTIVNGQTVTGEATGTSAAPLTFTTPDNCTQLLVEITSATEVTLSSATLQVVPATQTE